MRVGRRHSRYQGQRKRAAKQVEVDTAVTGNVIEGAAMAGIAVGAGDYLRDVTVSGRVQEESGAMMLIELAAFRPVPTAVTRNCRDW